LGEGNDSLIGETWSVSASANPLTPPAGIVNLGTIESGDGKDFISGYAYKVGYGIENLGTITTSSGDDTISASNGNSDQGTSLYNSGVIRTGTGQDTISGKDGAYGIFNLSGSIETEEGDDTINGTGRIVGIDNNSAIRTGSDDDTIYGKGGEYGIFTNAIASIDTGEGNDMIIGIGSIGIFNSGIITTGKGDDTVDALTGGYSGSGKTCLGEGNDTLIGFGTGSFDGGAGIKDTILLSDGDYIYNGFGQLANQANTDGYYKLTRGNIEMLIQSFELIGSASNPHNTIQMNLGYLYNIAGNTITANLLIF
jgi:Ca2+-binding RTX toxin-like protein